MVGAKRFILFGCLLQGALCDHWAAWMPETIQALSGSCVLIPCTFKIPKEHDINLKEPVIGMWKKGEYNNGKLTVFSSKQDLSNNKIEGKLTGNLLEKNCTTVLYNISHDWSNKFYFRIECDNPLKYSFQQEVQINIADSPPKPQMGLNKEKVKEGDSVSLTCSAPAPCPTLPPTLSWRPTLNSSTTLVQENRDKTRRVTSVMTFTATHSHHNQEFSCTALYRLADGSERTSKTSLTLNVQHSPKDTSIMVNRNSTLSCISKANPALINYTWYKVAGSEIKVLAKTQNLITNMTEATDCVQYYCEAQNKVGVEKSKMIQVQSETLTCHKATTMQHDSAFVSYNSPLSLLIGAASGAAGIMLLCILMQHLEKRKNRQKSSSGVKEKIIESKQTNMAGSGHDRAQTNTKYADIYPKSCNTQLPERGNMPDLTPLHSTGAQQGQTLFVVDMNIRENSISKLSDQQDLSESIEEATYGNIFYQPAMKIAESEKMDSKSQHEMTDNVLYSVCLKNKTSDEVEYATVINL